MDGSLSYIIIERMLGFCFAVQANRVEEPDDSSDDFIINGWDGLNIDEMFEDDESEANMPLESEDNDDFATSSTAAPNSVIIVTNLIEDAFTSSDAQVGVHSLS